MKSPRLQTEILLLSLLLFAQAGAAQNKAASSGKAATSGGSTPAQAEVPSGLEGGIKVHGHWTIVVRYADGRVASRNEFENALTTGTNAGNAALSQLLSRQYTVGTWEISFASTSTQDPCRTTNGTPVPCFIVESTSKNTGVFIFPNLSVQVPTSGTNAFSIVLSGTATAAGGSISSVSTSLHSCASSVSPSACSGSAESNSSFGFTGQNLATAISVQAGQSVSVTVVLSFS